MTNTSRYQGTRTRHCANLTAAAGPPAATATRSTGAGVGDVRVTNSAAGATVGELVCVLTHALAQQVVCRCRRCPPRMPPHRCRPRRSDPFRRTRRWPGWRSDMCDPRRRQSDRDWREPRRACCCCIPHAVACAGAASFVVRRVASSCSLRRSHRGGIERDPKAQGRRQDHSVSGRAARSAATSPAKNDLVNRSNRSLSTRISLLNSSPRCSREPR